MATLTPVATLNDNGVGIVDIEALLAAAADLSNSFLNDGNTMLFVKNNDAASKTVTMKSSADPFGRGGSADTNNDEAIVVPAGEMGFFPFLNQASWSGLATFTLSATTSVKIGIVRMRKLR